MKQIGIEVEATFTQKRPDGSYKKVVMATGASLEEGDDPSGCRRLLYEDLSDDLRACFNNRKRQTDALSPGEPSLEEPPPGKADYPETRGLKAPANPRGTKTRKKAKKKNNPGKPKTKMCAIHGVAMRRYTKNGGEWYSHNDETTSGEWCNGRKKK